MAKGFDGAQRVARGAIRSGCRSFDQEGRPRAAGCRKRKATHHGGWSRAGVERPLLGDATLAFEALRVATQARVAGQRKLLTQVALEKLSRRACLPKRYGRLIRPGDTTLAQVEHPDRGRQHLK